MLGSFIWWRILDLHPFGDEDGQSLRFDGGVTGELDGKGPELYQPFDNSAFGVSIVEYIAEWKGGNHLDLVRLEVVSQLP